MINKKNGAVEIAGQIIYPDCTSAQFGGMPVAKEGTRKTPSKDWEVFEGIVDAKLLAALRFRAGLLEEVTLRLRDNKPSSWDNWSEESELELKRKHDAWLRECLGEEPYQFSWGMVFSVYDKKTGASSIIIKYTH